MLVVASVWSALSQSGLHFLAASPYFRWCQESIGGGVEAESESTVSEITTEVLEVE